MKKTIVIILAFAIVLSCFVLIAPVTQAEAMQAKLGLGIITDTSGSSSATEAESGRAKVNSTVVAVLLDADNTVIDVKIDVVQPYINWDATGIVGEGKSFLTKAELKENYGMLSVSTIGKEWYEQAADLEAFWTGKTVEQVLATQVNDEQRPRDVDLASSVTIHIDAYLAAFAEAVDNAVLLGSTSTDTLVLTVVADNNRSKDAADDADGLAEAYVHYGAFTFDLDGVITASAINAMQARVNFDSAGQITSELVEDVMTKNELGADYGMMVASEIGKEWYEQVDAFEAYLQGKTAEEILSLEVEDGVTSNADLVGSVTITVSSLLELVDKASHHLAAIAPAEGVKTGLAVLTTLSGSTSAEDGEMGRAKVDITVVAVLVDTDGTILDVKIDTVQPYTSWDAEGKLVETKVFMTKRERGDEYGMRAVSAIECEWFEQVAALEEYLIGKTREKVLAMELDEESRPVDLDLAASVTVHVDSYLAAFEKAVHTATVLGASVDDSLGLGVTANTMRSKHAAADQDGLAQAYAHYGAVTFDSDGVVTSAIIDASQANIAFDFSGQVTTDLEAEQLTKHELGEEYGMRLASEIGKEWYEQADAYSRFIVGKTLDDILILASESGQVTQADLLASVTINISAMQEVVEKAYQDVLFTAE